MNRTLNRVHDEFQQEVVAFTASLSGLSERNGYHDKMSPEVVETLKFRNDPTSQYVRTRNDLVVTFPNGCTILCDPKTCSRKKADHRDFPIEMFPLVTAITLYKTHRILTLYCCRMIDFEFGFLATPSIGYSIKRVYYPYFRHSIHDPDKGKRLYSDVFPNAHFTTCDSGNGASGDPFVWIENSSLDHMRDWRDEMIRLINEFIFDIPWAYSSGLNNPSPAA